MLIDFRNLFPKYNLRFKGVLHLGANVGEEFPIYQQLGIVNQIWVEANPEIHAKLKENIKSNPHAFAYCFAVGDEDKQTILHISNNGSQSSSILELGTHKQQHPDVHYVKDIEVPMKRIDTFFTKEILSGYDLLVMDIQGAELFALIGMGDWIKNFKAIYTEFNNSQVYEGCVELNELTKYLGRFGFVPRDSKAGTNFSGTWGDILFIKQ